MLQQGIDIGVVDDIVTTLTIREIVDRFPDTMPVLARAGIDLCCGGAHTIAEAAALHGLDAATLMADVAAAIVRAQTHR
jgi:regulator of cell morphogenesis and NO signaling